MIRLSMKFLTLGLLVGCLLFFYRGRGVSQVPELRVVAVEQPDAPLVIVPTFVDSTNPLRPRFGYSITNITNKPIDAYTIEERVILASGSPIISTTFSQIPATKTLLRPREPRQEEGGSAVLYREPPNEIRLAIDFVEFADGTRWGNDSSKSGERLDGKRAGGRAAITKYQEILALQGIEALQRALSQPEMVSPDVSNASDNWRAGFESGVNLVRNRLATAKTAGGLELMKRELGKPFDSADGRQDP